jgi:hypothetical protein
MATLAQLDNANRALLTSMDNVQSAMWTRSSETQKRAAYTNLLNSRNAAEMLRLDHLADSPNENVTDFQILVNTLRRADIILDQIGDWYMNPADTTGTTRVTQTSGGLSTSPGAKDSRSNETTVTDPGTGKVTATNPDAKAPLTQAVQRNWVAILGGTLAVGAAVWYFWPKEKVTEE